jgi:hypothetical protein
MSQFVKLDIPLQYLSLFQSILKWLNGHSIESKPYQILSNLLLSSSLKGSYALHPDVLKPLCFFEGFALTYHFVQNEMILPNSFIYNVPSLHEYFRLLGVVTDTGFPITYNRLRVIHAPRNFQFYDRCFSTAPSEETTVFRKEMRLANKLFVDTGNRQFLVDKLLDYYSIYQDSL